MPAPTSAILLSSFFPMPFPARGEAGLGWGVLGDWTPGFPPAPGGQRVQGWSRHRARRLGPLTAVLGHDVEVLQVEAAAMPGAVSRVKQAIANHHVPWGRRGGVRARYNPPQLPTPICPPNLKSRPLHPKPRPQYPPSALQCWGGTSATRHWNQGSGPNPSVRSTGRQGR